MFRFASLLGPANVTRSNKLIGFHFKYMPSVHSLTPTGSTTNAPHYIAVKRVVHRHYSTSTMGSVGYCITLLIRCYELRDDFHRFLTDTLPEWDLGLSC